MTEEQKQKLEAQLWKIANELRGKMGADELPPNIFYGTSTRSKSWVRVLGVGEKMDVLIAEYAKIKSANYQLNFVYPTEEMRRKLNIINRDMTTAEKQSAMTSIKTLNKTLDDIDSGRVMVEDLPEDTLERLRALLISGSKNNG